MENKIILPNQLTAENGAKAYLNGEFRQNIFIEIDGNEELVEVVIAWPTIKDIYSKIVEKMGEGILPPNEELK